MTDESAPAALHLSSVVASRFVSSEDLEAARIKRAEEWQQLHEKLGQEVPPLPSEENYDPRSLYERLKVQRDSKQEAFEEKLKFKNQFRALDDEEVAFLGDVEEERREAEVTRQREIAEQLAEFKKAVAARSSLDSVTQIPISTTADQLLTSPPSLSNVTLPALKSPTATAATSTATSQSKKKPAPKSGLTGIIKKKTVPKRKTSDSMAPAPSNQQSKTDPTMTSTSKETDDVQTVTHSELPKEPTSKRSKVT